MKPFTLTWYAIRDQDGAPLARVQGWQYLSSGLAARRADKRGFTKEVYLAKVKPAVEQFGGPLT